MKKIALIMALALIATTAFAGTAFAYGGGYGSPNGAACLQEVLSEEDFLAFRGIMDSFREKMADLRTQLAELRESGDYEAFRERHEERFEIRAERSQALSELLPAEYAERFQNFGGMHNHACNREGESGFSMQQRQGR